MKKEELEEKIYQFHEKKILKTQKQSKNIRNFKIMR